MLVDLIWSASLEVERLIDSRPMRYSFPFTIGTSWMKSYEQKLFYLIL
jgi:hypothetical protein